MTLNKSQTFTLGEVKFSFNPKSKWIRVYVKGAKVKMVLKNELWLMMYTISQVKAQDDLIPAFKKEMMQFDRVHTIKATKDIKEGEIIKFHCHVDVPLTIVESTLTAGDVAEIRQNAERKAAGVINSSEAVKPVDKSVQ